MRLVEITDKQHTRQIEKENIYSLIQFINSNTPPWQLAVHTFRIFHLFPEKVSFMPIIFNDGNKIHDMFKLIYENLAMRPIPVNPQIVEFAKIWFDIPGLTTLKYNVDIYTTYNLPTAITKYLNKANEQGIKLPTQYQYIRKYIKNNIQTTPIPDAWKKYIGET